MINQDFFEHFLIRNTYPKAYTDFLEFYEQNNIAGATTLPIGQLSFPFQAGWFIAYFEQNAVTINLMDLTLEGLFDILPECFRNMEHVLSHYS